MKICRVLLGIIFTFLAIECQAGPKSKLNIVDILQENSGKLSVVIVRGFKDKKDFDLDNTKQFPQDKKDLFLRSLFNDDKAKTFFTGSILAGATTVPKGKSKGRATKIFSVTQENDNVREALIANPNKVIILDILQSELDNDLDAIETPGFSLTRTFSSFTTSPTKAPPSSSLRQKILDSLAEKLGVDLNKKPSGAAVTPTIVLPTDSSNVTMRKPAASSVKTLVERMTEAGKVQQITDLRTAPQPTETSQGVYAFDPATGKRVKHSTAGAAYDHVAENFADEETFDREISRLTILQHGVDPADKGALVVSLKNQIKANRIAATQAVEEAMTAQMSSTWSLITSTGFSKTEVKKGLGKDPVTPEEALFGALVFASQAVDDKVNLEVELDDLKSTSLIQETAVASAKVLSTATIPSHDYSAEIASRMQSPTRVDQSNQDVLIPSLKDQIKAIRLARTKVLGDITKGIQMNDALTLIKSAGFSLAEVKKGLSGIDPTSAEEALRGALTFANQEVDAKTDLEVELDELKATILASSIL